MDVGHILVLMKKNCGSFYKQYRKEIGKDRRLVVTHTMLFLGPVVWHRAYMRVPFGAQKTRNVMLLCRTALSTTPPPPPTPPVR